MGLFTIKKSNRFLPLRTRFFLITSLLLLVLLGTLAAVLGHLQAKTIKKQLRERGFSIAQSLVATSVSNLLTYNYMALEQAANKTANQADILYVIIHDKEGRVAGYSGRPGLQGKHLQDDLTQTVLRATQPLTQSGLVNETPVLDLAIPVHVADSPRRWGVIRVGMSLSPMTRQINQIQLIIFGLGILALLFGMGLSSWAANRITNPLQQLTTASQEAARGNLDQDIPIRSHDEVGILAANFRTMMAEILAHRKQLEMQLEEISTLKQYKESLLTRMADGLLSIGLQGQIRTLNPAAQAFLQTGSSAVYGRHFSDFVPSSEPLGVYIKSLLREPRSLPSKEVLFSRNGETLNLLVGSSILLDSAGRAQELILTMHDVTELKKLEGRVRQSERLAALGTLAAGLAHEIRNPLSAIKTFVQLLPKKKEKPSFLEKFDRTVPREIERINSLVEDLLVLSRIPQYKFESTSVPDLLNQALELHEQTFALHNIAVVCECNGSLPPVWADPDQLMKAFLNLIQNGLQAMGNQGELRIRGEFSPEHPSDPGKESPSGWVVLQFEDTGTGIPPGAMKNIFNPFFTTKETGTGLGLAITHKVVTEHQGSIEVENTREGGARFTLTLPARRDSSAI